MTPTLILIIFAVVGLVLYATPNPKPSEVGRIIFSWSFLVLCLEIARGIGVVEHLQRLGR
jgi:hypothetical protein